jgi:hypothetical protein
MSSGEGRSMDLHHSYIVRDGVVTEIQRHDDRKSAVAAVSGRAQISNQRGVGLIGSAAVAPEWALDRLTGSV